MIKRLLCLPVACWCFIGPFSVLAKDWDPKLGEASRLAYQGNTSQAEATIDAYIQAHPEDPNGLFIKGDVLDWKAILTFQPESFHRQVLGIYQKANTLAFQNWHQNPDNVDALIDLGNSYVFVARKYSYLDSWMKAGLTARKCQGPLEKAIRLDPSRLDALFSLGGFHYFASNATNVPGIIKFLLGIKGSKAQGLAELKQAVTGDYPFVIDAKYGLLHIYFEYEKDFEGALKILRDFQAQFPENPELVLRQAEIYDAQDHLKGANGYLYLVQWCEAKKDRCHPEYLFLAYSNAGRLFQGLGQNEKAKENFALALSHDLHLDSTKTAENYYGSGLIDTAENQNAAAMEKFENAKSTPGIPKKLKKDIEEAIKSLCKKENIPGKC